jgi:hypothetical protein
MFFSASSITPSLWPSSAIEWISCSEPFPRQEDVRHADERAGRDGERAPEQPHERRQRERHPIAVEDAERLRHRLDDDEVREREDEGGDRDPDVAEVVLGEEGNQDRRAVLHDHDCEVDRVQVGGGLALDRLEAPRVPPALGVERRRPRARHAADGRLGHREHGAHRDHRGHDADQPGHRQRGRRSNRRMRPQYGGRARRLARPSP